MQTHANSQSVWTYYPRPQHVCHICVRRVPHCAFHTTRGSYKLIYGSFRFTERLYWPKFDMLYCAVTDLNKNVTPDRHFSRTVPQYNTILTTWLKVKVLSILRWCKSSLVKTCCVAWRQAFSSFSAMECSHTMKTQRCSNRLSWGRDELIQSHALFLFINSWTGHFIK